METRRSRRRRRPTSMDISDSNSATQPHVRISFSSERRNMDVSGDSTRRQRMDMFDNSATCSLSQSTRVPVPSVSEFYSRLNKKFTERYTLALDIVLQTWLAKPTICLVSPPNTGKTSFLEFVHQNLKDRNVNVVCCNLSIRDEDTNFEEYIPNDVKSYDYILLDDSDIPVLKFYEKPTLLGQVSNFFKGLLGKKIMMTSVTSFAVPILRDLGFSLSLQTVDVMLGQRIFGITNDFLSELDVERYQKIKEGLQKFCYHRTANREYYLINPTITLLMETDNMEEVPEEPDISQMVWKICSKSPTLQDAVRELLGGHVQCDNFNFFKNRINDVYLEKSAAFQLMWHYGMLFRLKTGASQYTLELNELIKGETLTNTLKSKLERELCHVSIEFDTLLENKNYLDFHRTISYEFSRSLLCYDFPIASKLGVIKKNAQALLISSCRRSYKCYSQSVGPSGRFDILLVPHYICGTPIILELKEITMTELVAYNFVERDTFEQKLLAAIKTQAMKVEDNTLNDPQYLHHTLIGDFTECICLTMVFCYTLCGMEHRAYQNVEGMWFKKEDVIYEPPKFEKSNILKLFTYLEQRRLPFFSLMRSVT